MRAVHVGLEGEDTPAFRPVFPARFRVQAPSGSKGPARAVALPCGVRVAGAWRLLVNSVDLWAHALVQMFTCVHGCLADLISELCTCVWEKVSAQGGVCRVPVLMR